MSSRDPEIVQDGFTGLRAVNAVYLCAARGLHCVVRTLQLCEIPSLNRLTLDEGCDWINIPSYDISSQLGRLDQGCP